MDAVQEVKSRLSIEDVISEYVQLKRAGKNYKGLSPFTSEKTPSFVVSPDKQIWHDFSSNRGGDIFTFIQEVEGVDFRGSLELLSRKAGVDLEQYQGKGRDKGPDKERLYSLLEAATKFYQVQLGANKAALEYVAKKRGFTRETILGFQLGYSPDLPTGQAGAGRALVDYLLKKGFKEIELKTAGLTAQRRGGMGDMFRGRIMVPLHDPFGRVVGFTARLLHDTPGAPKYINTPATPLYDKSRHIYGLHFAKQAIQRQKFSVLCEGNLDVIASHQAGVQNVVATAGTALTEMQLKALGRLSPDVRLAFDQDRAGIAATERAIPIASKVDVELSVITIPNGKDPDELIKQDKEAWPKAITEHIYALDWLVEAYKKRLDLNSAAGKRQFSDVVLVVVRGLKDKVEQDHYIQKIAEILEVSTDSIRTKLTSGSASERKILRKAKPIQQQIEIDPEFLKTSDRLLSLTLMMPGTRGYLEHVTESMFAREDARQLFNFIKSRPDYAGNLKELEDYFERSEPAHSSSAREQAREVRGLGQYAKILSLQFEELYGTVDPLELQYEAARLRSKLIEIFVKNEKRKLAAALMSAEDDESQRLLEKVRDLDQLLNRIKE